MEKAEREEVERQRRLAELEEKARKAEEARQVMLRSFTSPKETCYLQKRPSEHACSLQMRKGAGSVAIWHMRIIDSYDMGRLLKLTRRPRSSSRRTGI